MAFEQARAELRPCAAPGDLSNKRRKKRKVLPSRIGKPSPSIRQRREAYPQYAAVSN
jgi:hypothetical protein